MSSIPTQSFDLVVLGGGSGGLAAAKRAAGHGAHVAVVEAYRLGGTCVIRGCVPKKLMVYASQLGSARALSADYGWSAAPPDFSWPAMRRMRDQIVNNLELAHSRHLAQAGVQVYAARARLSDAHTVSLTGATQQVVPQRLRGEHILLAMGAKPLLPDIDGAHYCLSSDSFFELEEMPASTVLVGGGYIAAEFACLLAGLGCRVTLVVRSRLLRDFDHDISAALHQSMRTLGITVVEGAQVAGIEPKHHQMHRVRLQVGDQRQDLQAQACVLFATGRLADTQDMNLVQNGVELDKDGAVCVDAYHQTTLSSISAIGDVINRANLTPVAIKAGRAFADCRFGGQDVAVNYQNIPTAVFSEPPVGAVGLTEAQAQKAYPGDVAVFKSRFVPLKYAASPPQQKRPAMVKVVVQKSSDKVLGLHLLGDDAPEIIQGFATALGCGLTKQILDQTFAVHPTLAEELVLLRAS